MIFELILDSHTVSNNLGNDELNEIASIEISSKGDIRKGKKSTLGFIITDISEYNSFEYNPSDMSISKSDINVSEIKQMIKRSIQGDTIDQNKKKEVDMGIVAPSPSVNL